MRHSSDDLYGFVLEAIRNQPGIPRPVLVALAIAEVETATPDRVWGCVRELARDGLVRFEPAIDRYFPIRGGR
jgi:hypothetical protein